jgi:hypothetical protein
VLRGSVRAVPLVPNWLLQRGGIHVADGVEEPDGCQLGRFGASVDRRRAGRPLALVSVVMLGGIVRRAARRHQGAVTRRSAARDQPVSRNSIGRRRSRHAGQGRKQRAHTKLERLTLRP